ncbi:MAG: response regulator [Sulfurimonas sp.]|uniref:response regulator n=1 Tax=Sulfurimonas sp. TaxID=2022749 RepID=UPI002616E7AF|nr:response regulator [Sulfurimonas sp.]MCW8896035.1 response regulator [Sulfurimonas sp.]MCW8954654.1 response regulator [Sulfurimonas sp.]MCW9067462.1 response regulator [Sulfurimonas sp.]
MPYEVDSSVLEYLKSLTLLCVEDNKTTQLIYDSIFEDIVGEIIFADNGEDGYKKFIEKNINLIISDYDMPILNGIDMIEKIRKIDKDIPIILVTAIQEIDVTVKALQLNVNNFLAKPIKSNEVMKAIENVSKILIVENYLKEQREQKIKALEDKDEYNTYQEDLAFDKELNIVRNDFYYQMMDTKCHALIDFFYKPLDVLSGDAYSVRKINDNLTFYLIVDGMGKGLSASLSSMLITSFINHTINMMDKDNNFDLHRVIESSLEYIKPILLSEEALAVDYIVIDCKKSKMHYAKFAMPTIILQNNNNEIIKIKSNNQPISKYIKDFQISTYDTSNITKFLFYSDGMVENTTLFDSQIYSQYIENDFLESFTKEDMVAKFKEKNETQEDDITFIFINMLQLHNDTQKARVFQSSLDALDEANEWYAQIWDEITTDVKQSYNAGVVFTELFMNAFEHGNLGLDSDTKHRLLSEDKYIETLIDMQKVCDKKITVSVNIVDYFSERYLITRIEDEGDGFDTKILGNIFKKNNSFNGRGVYISKKSSMGIYYNSIGNSVLSLHKI